MTVSIKLCRTDRRSSSYKNVQQELYIQMGNSGQQMVCCDVPIFVLLPQRKYFALDAPIHSPLPSHHLTTGN